MRIHTRRLPTPGLGKHILCRIINELTFANQDAASMAIRHLMFIMLISLFV